MAKKSKQKRNIAAAEAPLPPVRRRKWRVIAALLATVCALLSASYAATRYAPVRRVVGLAPLPAPIAPQGGPGSLSLAKEYIYAGGRLIATEEPTPVPTPTPTPGPVGSPPSGFIAVFDAAASGGTGAVTLNWAKPSGTITGYVVERRQSLGVNDPVTNIPVSGDVESYTDAPGTGDNAYLYRVRALFANGTTSPYSDYDLATTVPFTDSSLQGTVIKATHLTELRRAVRAVWTLTGQGQPTWTYPDPTSQSRQVYLEDMTELRQRLDAALTQLDTTLGVQKFLQPYPATPALSRNQPIYAAHFQQIRDRLK